MKLLILVRLLSLAEFLVTIKFSKIAIPLRENSNILKNSSIRILRTNGSPKPNSSCSFYRISKSSETLRSNRIPKSSKTPRSSQSSSLSESPSPID